MKLIVDENLPRRLVAWLKAKGSDAVHVADLGLLGADDAAVWQASLERGALIVSRDADFVERATRSVAGGTIRLTIGNCTTAQLLEWLETRWDEIVRRVEVGERVVEI